MPVNPKAAVSRSKVSKKTTGKGSVSEAEQIAELQRTIKTQQESIDELTTKLHQTVIDVEHNRVLEDAQALTHLGSWQWDVVTNAISWSDELYRIYGLKPQEREVGFEEFMGMIHEEDRERVGAIISNSFQSGTPFSFEHRIVRPNGNLRYLYGMGKVVRNSKGEPMRMIGTSQDITARKAVEEALNRSNERFQAITQATHDLVYDLDLHHNSIWFNEELQSEYGYNASQGSSDLAWWISHIHPEDRERIETQINMLKRSDQQVWRAEFRFCKADGSYAVVRNRAYVLRDTEGKPERIVGSCLDITEAQRLDRAKDEFISLVSHQLRTPLTVIQLYGNMLHGGMAGVLEPLQAEYVDKMTNASVRLIKLVGDILNISRLELNRIRIDAAPTDVISLIQTHIDELTPAAKAKNVSISFKPTDKLKPVKLDSTIFGEIVHNLISNAVRYVHNDIGKITVAFEKTDDHYLLTVSDNGIGIPKTAQPHIFERFYRASNAARIDGEGTGLGLYLVKLFADTAGGDAWFTSSEGKGTTFSVSFPLKGMRQRRPENGHMSHPVS